MVSKIAVFASLLATAIAKPCPKPPVPGATPQLPSTGATDLNPPPAGTKLLQITVGHGIQNYSCASTTANATLVGALATLYDTTKLYPGTPGSTLDQAAFDALSSVVLWTQDIPLNLVDPSSANPGTPNTPNSKPGSSYAADGTNPFPAPKPLSLPGMPEVPFAGVHYFDASGTPTFDLSASGLLAHVGKAGEVSSPGSADKGIVGTGAVGWLALKDSGKGVSKGVSFMYRVITAGGKPQSCSLGEPTFSVPYAAAYWFYGP